MVCGPAPHIAFWNHSYSDRENINVDEMVGERKTLLAQRRRRSIVARALGIPAIAERLAIARRSVESMRFSPAGSRGSTSSRFLDGALHLRHRTATDR